MLPVMYLQADNSAKNNKNKLSPFFFGNGREDKYPEENQAYSPDGRTCSRGHISDVQLHQQKSPNTQAYNIPDLQDMVRASFTPKPDAGHMESLLDFGRKDIIGE